MAKATKGADGDALLDTTADASVRILDVLHRATQLYSAAVSESGCVQCALACALLPLLLPSSNRRY